MGTVSKIHKRKGPPKGTRHSGSFSKGFDSRRHLEGPRVVKKAFQEAIREHTDTAIQVLSDCMEDTTAPWKERQAAAELTLNYGHGSPVNRVLHAQASTVQGNISDADPDTLLRLLESRTGHVIEGALHDE